MDTAYWLLIPLLVGVLVVAVLLVDRARDAGRAERQMRIEAGTWIGDLSPDRRPSDTALGAAVDAYDGDGPLDGLLGDLEAELSRIRDSELPLAVGAT